jgi:hypothetical protein
LHGKLLRPVNGYTHKLTNPTKGYISFSYYLGIVKGKSQKSMSHLHERSEKICLNCGSELTGRFCHNCGQENLEPKESFSHLVRHFFEDFTHFDGKFFRTIKVLLLKPGFLTEEYLKGKRASYLNPIRMYLFISAAFFLIYMSFFIPHTDPVKIKETSTKAEERRKERSKKIQAGMGKIIAGVDSLKLEEEEEKPMAREAFHNTRLYLDSLDDAGKNDTIDNNSGFFGEDSPNSLVEYDSLQKTLPEKERDGKIERYFSRKFYKASDYGRENPGELKHRIAENYYHSLPYMLFISLPLIALLLRLLYIRRKQFFYVSHIIFTLHLYCSIFILILLLITARQLPGKWHLIWLIPFFGIIVYIYKAMRRFYKQKRFKTFVKFFLFLSIGGTLIGILAAIFAFKSFLDIG